MGIYEICTIIFMSKLETSKMVLILFFGGISIKFCKFFNTNTHYHFLYDLQLMATENKSMLGDKTRKELKISNVKKNF